MRGPELSRVWLVLRRRGKVDGVEACLGVHPPRAALQPSSTGGDVTKPGEGSSMEQHSKRWGRRLPSWKILEAGGALGPHTRH